MNVWKSNTWWRSLSAVQDDIDSIPSFSKFDFISKIKAKITKNNKDNTEHTAEEGRSRGQRSSCAAVTHPATGEPGWPDSPPPQFEPANGRERRSVAERETVREKMERFLVMVMRSQ